MSENIIDVVQRWLDATGEIMVDAVRDWEPETDCPGFLWSHEIDEASRFLVRWCDSTSRQIDPTPITECMRHARKCTMIARIGDGIRAQAAYNSFCEAWDRCIPLLDRIKHAANASDEFIGPMTPAEWRKRFGKMSESTWRREKKKMSIDEITSKNIRIHRDDVARYEKKRLPSSH